MKSDDEIENLEKQLESARAHIRTPISDARVRWLQGRIESRLARRKWARPALGLAAVTCASLLVWFLWSPEPQPPVADARDNTPSSSESSRQRTIAFVDGSAISLDDESVVTTLTVTEALIEVELEQGRANFQVTPNPQRTFIVHAGSARVSVLGTTFTMTFAEDSLTVEVEEGTVRVESRESDETLTTNQRTQVSAAAAAEGGETHRLGDPEQEIVIPPEVPAAEVANAEEPSAEEPSAEEPSAEEPPPSHEASLEDLLAAADSARLSGDAQRAARILRRGLRRYPSDPSASLASFTLGRLLLGQLGQPSAAARAFAEARRLAPTGALFEDCMAREVEALSRAGEDARARALAEQYVVRFPNGRRTNLVRRYGGLR